jgi:hypothetical protein
MTAVANFDLAVPFARETDGGEVFVRCPRCAGTYNHPVKAVVETGDEVTKVTSKETSVRPRRGPFGQGVVITLDFEGERGHGFSVAFGFHKGNTGVEVHGVKKLRAFLPHGVIWRD